MNGPGRALITAGLVLVAAGVLISFAPKFPTWLGRLPGDITFKRGTFSFYFPLATCVLLSAILSFILWLLKK
jgi:hypothetical protein